MNANQSQEHGGQLTVIDGGRTREQKHPLANMGNDLAERRDKLVGENDALDDEIKLQRQRIAAEQQTLDIILYERAQNKLAMDILTDAMARVDQATNEDPAKLIEQNPPKRGSRRKAAASKAKASADKS